MNEQILPKPADLRPIICPYPTLAMRAKVVTVKENEFEEPELIKEYCEKMISILESFKGTGIGIAANQVGLLLRIFVCLDNLNISTEKRNIEVYVNPKILSYEKEQHQISEEEGCLSFPGIKGYVSRCDFVEIAYRDIHGKRHVRSDTGLQARCWMHEIDHLDGINIPRKFSQEDLRKNKIALKKLKWNKLTRLVSH